MAEPTVRESLEASFEKLEENTGDATTGQALEQPNVATTTEGQGDAGKANVSSDGVLHKPAPKVQTSLTDTPPQTTAKLEGNGQQPAGDQSVITVKAPVAWKPEVREKWSGLPPEVQQEVIRREKDHQAALQQSAHARSFFENFQRVVAPHQQLIMLEGDDPIKSFGHYLRTATILRTGTPQEKAIAVAQAIGTYAIDVNMLDQALAAAMQGQPMPQGQASGQMHYRDPRVDQMLASAEQQYQSSMRQLDNELTNEVEAFAADPKNEFFEDVKQDVSLLLKFNAERGKVMTLSEAYQQACLLHPTISKVVTQRQAAQTAQQQQQQHRQRQAAASSVSMQTPRQTGNAGGEAPTVRQAIEQSIESLS